jgi:Tfp pilus assembly protein PilP
MSGQRGLTVLGGCAVAAVWLVSGSGLPVDTSVGAAKPRAAAPPAVVLESVPAVQMDRLAVAPRPQPSSRRDPFRFAHAPRHTSSDAADPIGAAAPHETVAAVPEQADPLRPELRLIGLAQDTLDGTVVRTAVITAPNQVYLVREGEQIALRFLVDRIGADAVQLRDLANDGTIVLALR